jgi:hypothetical protein
VHASPGYVFLSFLGGGHLVRKEACVKRVSRPLPGHILALGVRFRQMPSSSRPAVWPPAVTASTLPPWICFSGHCAGSLGGGKICGKSKNGPLGKNALPFDGRARCPPSTAKPVELQQHPHAPPPTTSLRLANRKQARPAHPPPMASGRGRLASCALAG